MRKISYRNLTEPQKRYAAVGKLISLAVQILLRSEEYPPSLPDLHADLKSAAARNALRYDSVMVCTAADIGLRRVKEIVETRSRRAIVNGGSNLREERTV